MVCGSNTASRIGTYRQHRPAFRDKTLQPYPIENYDASSFVIYSFSSPLMHSMHENRDPECTTKERERGREKAPPADKWVKSTDGAVGSAGLEPATKGL